MEAEVNTEITEANAKIKMPNVTKMTPAEPKNKAYREMVYCGPTVIGVASQFTVYRNGIPAPLQEFIDAHPAAKGLMVPLERFAKARIALETPGSAENVLYQRIVSDL